MKRLFGQTLPPSIADHGVARWIGSLGASPANPTVGQESGPVPPTTVMSGPSPDPSSSPSDPALSSWRMFQESFGITTTESGQNFAQWVTELRKDFSRRKKLVLLTEENGFSSWPTPTTAPEAPNLGSNKVNGPRSLGEAAGGMNWPTPVASDANKRGQGENYKPESRLGYKVKLWSTPTNRDWKDGSTSQENRPENVDGERGKGPALGRDVLMWPTPIADDAEETKWNGADHRTPMLAWASRNWPTPRENDWRGGSDETPENGYLDRTAQNWSLYFQSFHSVPTTAPPGHICSQKCRRLNPQFVEWLMGWPIGWTLLPFLDPGSHGSERLEMEWCRWWQVMGSAFSVIAPE